MTTWTIEIGYGTFNSGIWDARTYPWQLLLPWKTIGNTNWTIFANQT